MFGNCLIFVVIVHIIRIAFAQNEPGAIWMPSPHHTSGRGGHVPKWLIIHGTAGGSSAEAIGEWFQDPAAQAATHYVVGQDGHVVQCVSEADTAWGNGRIEAGADSWWGTNPSPNQATISIEHVKSSTDNSNELTPEQTTASFNLITNILLRNPTIKTFWANSSGGFTGHFSMSPLSRERCPGPFPWEQLFMHLNGETKPICMATVNGNPNAPIHLEPNSETPIVGNLPQSRIINVQSRILDADGGHWFLLEDASGYVSGTHIKVHIKQPDWCSGTIYG